MFALYSYGVYGTVVLIVVRDCIDIVRSNRSEASVAGCVVVAGFTFLQGHLRKKKNTRKCAGLAGADIGLKKMLALLCRDTFKVIESMKVRGLSLR